MNRILISRAALRGLLATTVFVALAPLSACGNKQPAPNAPGYYDGPLQGKGNPSPSSAPAKGGTV